MKKLDEILMKMTPELDSSGDSTDHATDDLRSSGAERPPCPKCGGAGFLRRELPLDHPEFGKAVPCDCVLAESEETRLARLQRYSSLGPLTRLTFANLLPNGRSDNPDDREAFRVLVGDATAFAEEPEGWLLIHGSSGAGKTHVAAAVANRCLERGQPALFVVVPDLLDNLRAAYDPDSDIGFYSLLEQIRNAPVLILDDLGIQKDTAWAEEKLFQVLNHRYNAHLPTVVTTNLALDRLDGRLHMRLTDAALTRVYHVEAAARRVDLNLPDAFNLDRIRAMSFENFDNKLLHLSPQDRWSIEGAYRAAQQFAEDPVGWFLLIGPNGCGKTHLAAAIANRRRARGERPVFFVVDDLLDYLRYLMDRNSGPTFLDGFNQIRNAPLLILDDLSGESDIPWVRRRLYRLIDYRYMAQLPTVFTATRDSIAELDKRLAILLNDPTITSAVSITAPSYSSDESSYEAEGSRDSTRRGRPRRSRPSTR